jgi:Flp pilus assembly protein TadD
MSEVSGSSSAKCSSADRWSSNNSASKERFIRHAIELGATSAEAEFGLGVILSRKGLWRDAVPHLRCAIELGGENADAYLHLGEALNCTDDLSGALSAFERARDLDPVNERALRGLGVVYDRIGRAEKAVEMYHLSRRVRKGRSHDAGKMKQQRGDSAASSDAPDKTILD